MRFVVFVATLKKPNHHKIRPRARFLALSRALFFPCFWGVSAPRRRWRKPQNPYGFVSREFFRGPFSTPSLGLFFRGLGPAPPVEKTPRIPVALCPECFSGDPFATPFFACFSGGLDPAPPAENTPQNPNGFRVLGTFPETPPRPLFFAFFWGSRPLPILPVPGKVAGDTTP